MEQPRRKSNDHTWDTAAEVAFLRHLGTGIHSSPNSHHLRGQTRLTLLQRYHRSMGLRAEWGELRRATIEKALWKFLLDAQAQAAKDTDQLSA